jgi:GCN5-related N-acetyl-transferase
MDTEVRNNAERSRYELVVDSEVVGIADYRDQGELLVFPHTQIKSSMRGQGLGAVLVRATGRAPLLVRGRVHRRQTRVPGPAGRLRP